MPPPRLKPIMLPSNRPRASNSKLMRLLKPPKLLKRKPRRMAKKLIRPRRRLPMLPSPKLRSTKRSKPLKTRPKRAIRRRQRRSRKPKLTPKRSRTRAMKRSA